MSEFGGYDEASRPGRTRGAHPVRNAIIATLLVAFTGLGIYQSGLTETLQDPPATEAPTGGDTSGSLLALQTTPEEVEELSTADVAEIAGPSVVTVYNLQSVASQGPMFNQQPGSGTGDEDAADEPQAVGAGSGWIYDAEGHVVTNAHVVDGAEEVQVQFHDGTTAMATVVGVDPLQDVAVLKLDLEDGQELPGVAIVGDSDDLRPGEGVVAIGSPLGEYSNSVSEGIVGGLDRSLQTDVGSVLANLIQHDAPISSGNSGGPLLNMRGEVIGMNVAKIDTDGAQGVSVSGLNFAIDGNTVVDKVEQIIKDGEVVYPYLGVETQQGDAGTLVVNVVEGGPAEDAGLQAGDVITEVDGVPIGPDADLSQLLYEHLPGDTIDLTIERDGETVVVSVTLGERPSSLS